jgi:hypothetical protein
MNELKLQEILSEKENLEGIQRSIDLTKRMLTLADEGDAAREDTGCSILYSVLRDSAY